MSILHSWNWYCSVPKGIIHIPTDSCSMRKVPWWKMWTMQPGRVPRHSSCPAARVAVLSYQIDWYTFLPVHERSCKAPAGPSFRGKAGGTNNNRKDQGTFGASSIATKSSCAGTSNTGKQNNDNKESLNVCYVAGGLITSNQWVRVQPNPTICWIIIFSLARATETVYKPI